MTTPQWRRGSGLGPCPQGCCLVATPAPTRWPDTTGTPGPGQCRPRWRRTWSPPATSTSTPTVTTRASCPRPSRSLGHGTRERRGTASATTTAASAGPGQPASTRSSLTWAGTASRPPRPSSPRGWRLCTARPASHLSLVSGGPRLSLLWAPPSPMWDSRATLQTQQARKSTSYFDVNLLYLQLDFIWNLKCKISLFKRYSSYRWIKAKNKLFIVSWRGIHLKTFTIVEIFVFWKVSQFNIFVSISLKTSHEQTLLQNGKCVAPQVLVIIQSLVF